MNDEIKINLPKLGESIVSATVVQWFKKVGDFVALDEPLLEVSTDKVNSEIPSPQSGILHKILVQVDEEVQVGAALAILKAQGAAPVAERKKESSVETSISSFQEASDILSPAVLRLLKEKEISLKEVGQIPHTGQGARLTKKDVENYSLSKAGKAKKQPVCPAAAPKGQEEYERVKMSTLRKSIAENMVRSFYEAPHASLLTEVDVTRIMKLIQEHKSSFFQEHGAKLSITAFVARAIAQTVQKYPLLNASLEGDTIVMKHFVNLGIAVSVDQGVMVPVVRKCDQLFLSSIAKEIASLAEKARKQQLSAPEVQEGTITMTNFGMTGTMVGIPIIRYPEVAIVGLGAVTKKVVAMPDDSIAIRSIMWVSLTFDHRVLDGLYGCAFLNALKTDLEREDLTIT